MTESKSIEQHLGLVQRLYARTCDGKVDWEYVRGESKVVTQLGHFIVELRMIPDPDYPDQPDFGIAIIDEGSKEEIEQFTNVMLRPVMDTLSEEGLNPYSLMKYTFDIARRKARGADVALEKILESLTEE